MHYLLFFFFNLFYRSENWGSKRVFTHPNPQTWVRIVGWVPRFVLLENPFSCCSTIFKCNLQKVKITLDDKCYISSSLYIRVSSSISEHKGRSETVSRRGRGSGKASPRMWHLSWAMLNSWSQSCWITNVLIFWLHLLGTYQSHKVKEAIILLWPPKLLKQSHLLFLHPLVSHRGFLK